MTDRTHPEALRLANSITWMDAFTDFQRDELDKSAAELRRQHARIAELEAQLSAIGAGGVSGPLMGRASLAASAGSEPVAPDQQPMPETWSVVASVHGERILSIGESWVSGKGELTEAETKAVIGMAQHLLSFVGYGLPPSSVAPDADDAALNHTSPPEGAGWSPIETAPKDGTPIIAYRPSSPPHIECMNWCAYEDADIPGAWHWAYDGDAPRENPPTHWMPLPAPPASEAKGA